MSNSQANSVGYVFLHGAGYGSWIWEKVIPLLNAPTLAIDFPGRGKKTVSNIKAVPLADYTKSALVDIRSFPAKQFVLVAHSFSGTVALEIASQLPERVKSLVFLTAAAPESGKSYVSLLPLPQQIVLRLILKFTSGRPPESAIRQECRGVDEEVMKTVLARYTNESPHIWLDPVTWDIPESLPRFYIQDESDFPNTKSIAQLKPEKVVKVATGHLSMLSQPKAIADLLTSFV